MVTTCCAFGCTNRFSKLTGIGFFRFPQDPARRKLWGLALRRKGFEPKDSHRICGEHFQSGRPSTDPKHPDYIPNIFNFNNPERKHRSGLQSKVLEEDPKNENIIKNIIEVTRINPELFSICDINFEELSEMKTKVLEMKSEIEKQSTETLNSEYMESACESLGSPSTDLKHPDYVPNVIKFKNPVRKHRNGLSRKVRKEDPKNENTLNSIIEVMPINPKLFSICDINFEELLGMKTQVLEMQSEIENQTTETLDSEDTESACESLGEEGDEYFSLKLELYEAYNDISALKKEKDEVIMKSLAVSEAEREVLRNVVSDKEAELSKLKLELRQAYEEINVLRSEKDAMQKKITSLDITNRILQDAKELYYYTGVHSTKDFHSILSLLHDVDTNVKLFPMTTQLLIVLMNLRLNLNPTDLSFRFQTSRTTVEKICSKMIPFLEKKLELLIKCPITNALKKTLPPSYRKNTVFETLYNRIQRYVKSKARECVNEDSDCEST